MMMPYKPQYNVFTQPGKPPVAPTASPLPGPMSDISSGGFPYTDRRGTFGTPPVPSVPPTPSDVGATGTSIGSSPMGNMRIPDLSSLSPEARAALVNKLESYTWSVPGGGYLTNAEAQNANSYYNKFGGSDPLANEAVGKIYSFIGSFPTTSGATAALQGLRQSGGAPTTHYPPLNQILGKPYGGPFAFPGWNLP